MVRVVRGILCGFVVLLLAGFLAFSAQIAPTKALDVSSNVNIKPSLTVTIPVDEVHLELDPAENSFDHEDFKVSVGTNNYAGYQLIVSAPTSSLTNAENGRTLNSLPVLAGGYTEETFTPNRWGYKINDNNYLSFQRETTMKTSNVPVNKEETNITLGAKIDHTQPGGLYETTLAFNVVPEIMQEEKLDDGYMQNMDPMLCTEEPTIRTDSRDGQQYVVQRLADGNCWMLDNLRLGGDTAIELTPEDTNIEANWTLPASGEVCFTSSSCTGSDGVTTGGGYTVPAINTDYEDEIVGSHGVGSHKLGVYYNYCAVSAGTYCYSYSSNSSSTSTGKVEVTQDVCPAGWHMPAGYSGSDYGAIYKLYQIYDSEWNAFADILSIDPGYGYYYTKSNGVGERYIRNGLLTSLWSQRKYLTSNNGSIYSFVIHSDSSYTYTNDAGTVFYGSYNYPRIYDSSTIYRYYAYPVRCMFESNYQWQTPQITMDMISTMQQLNDLSDEQKEFLVENMSVGKNYTLKDERDGQEYTVAKLRDGNLWMTQNLNLGATDITVDLTNKNTNIASTIAADEFNSWRKTSSSSSDDNGNNAGYTQGEYIPVSGMDTVSGTPYGTLYNYYAASAGTKSGKSTKGGAVSDICPAGWRMPTGGYDGEFQKIMAIYYTVDLMNASITDGGAGFARAGYFSGGTPRYAGTYSYYWGSTTHTNYSGIPYLYSSGITTNYRDSSTSGTPATGYSIRCVFDPYTDVFKKAGVSTMQQFKKLSMLEKLTLINSMKENHNYSLVDNRDGGDYTVAKLKDGNLWMTTNLNLGGSSYSDYGQPLNSDNTNMAEGATAITAATVKGWWWDYQSGSNVSESYTAGKALYYPYSNRDLDPSSDSAYGARYNYVAASANTRNTATITDDATYDICPAGWRLPTGGPTGELTNLYNLYGSREKMLASVEKGGVGLARGGTWAFQDTSSGTSFSYGLYGYLWSSYLKTGTSMSVLYLNADGVQPDYSLARNKGASVRCVVKFDMQEFNNLTPTEKSVVIGSMETGKNYVFNDSRDGRSYTVAKLKDGNVWMTENLNLGATAVATTISLNSTNTNIPTNLTVTAATFNGWKKTAGTNVYTAGQFIALPKTTYGTDSTSLIQYGALYNYFAVSMGTMNTAVNLYDATIDICPAGWRLPTGGTNSEFSTLIGKYPSGLVQNPVASGGAAFTLAGYFPNSAPKEQEDTGEYWSSTMEDDAYMFVASTINNSSFGVGQDDRKFGLSVRCMLKPVSETAKNGAWWYSPSDSSSSTGGETPGCFAAGTEVTTSLDGETKPIEEIKIGDEVVSYDPDKNEYYMTKVLDTIVHNGDERSTKLADLVLDDGTVLNMTLNHPVLTTDGYKAIKEENYPTLTMADTVITTTGEHAISNIRIHDVSPTIVYNLTVEGRDPNAETGPTHSYIANGVIVHNAITGSV